jgi:hypothetical protein
MFKNLTIKEAVDPFKNQGTEHRNSWTMQMTMIRDEGFADVQFIGAW